MTWSWDEMIEEFRALGGVADNVERKEGAFGWGLFPIDPKKPISIRVPDNLLFDPAKLGFENGKLRVKEKTPEREREEKFLEKFEDTFSWGGSGRKDCEAKMKKLLELPEAIRELLIAEFGLKGLFAETDDETVQNRFLQSRKIRYKDRTVIMPVLELANHGTDGVSFQFSSGISLKGKFDGEILARYSGTDPFGIFCGWGFPSDEFIAFSLPLQARVGTRQFVIGRNLAQRDVKGRFYVPKLTQDGSKVTLSYMMLGNKKFPRLAKGVFFRLMKDIKQDKAEELFDRILHVNIKKFLNLLSALEAFEGPTITELRRVARFQLEAMSYCIGVREL